MQFMVPLLLEGGATGQVGSRAVRRLESDWRFRLWNVEPGRIHVPAPSTEVVRAIVRLYGMSVSKPNPTTWIDHTPTNLRHLRLLTRAFPDARAIHIVRGGRAVAASLMQIDWGPNTIAAAADYWTNRICHGLAAEMAFAGKFPLIRVHYEQLVARPQEVVRSICDSLELSYLPEMARASGFAAPDYTASIHQLIGQPPDRRRIEGWRAKLTVREIEIFENLTGDLLSHLGYERDFEARARPATRREHIHMRAYEAYRARVNKIRRRRRRWRHQPG
jgi:hypothetical protein